MAVETDPKKREFYLQDLPMTEEKLAESNVIIEDALYNIGFIYKDGLKDNQKSIESFEELLEKFPEHENKLQVYYQLYKNYEEVPNQERADYYKDLIVKDFPDSDYAKIIVDPNYNLVLEAQRNAASKLYENTYEAYMNNQYYLVINNYNEAATNYQESELISKFEFLKAMSLGKIQDLDTLAVSLQMLVDSFPNSEVTPLAEDILSRLRPDQEGKMQLEQEPIADAGGKAGEESAGKPSKEFTTVYKTNKESVHFFMALVDGSKTNINALKIRLSDFNAKYYVTAQLKINNIVFQGDIQLITVGNFENSGKALDYYESVINDNYITSQLENLEESAYTISVENYPVFYREKNIEGYYDYFNEVYLEKTTGDDEGEK